MRDVFRLRDFILHFSNLIEHRGSVEERVFADGAALLAALDIHRAANALTDRASISIHVDGANIGAGKRNLFGVENGAVSPFVSVYSNRTLPNLWDRPDQVRAAMGR